MTPPMPRWRAGAALALLSLLAACAGAPPPRLILLSNDVAVAPASDGAQRPVLAVRAVTMPEYLDRRSIV